MMNRPRIRTTPSRRKGTITALSAVMIVVVVAAAVFTVDVAYMQLTLSCVKCHKYLRKNVE